MAVALVPVPVCSVDRMPTARQISMQAGVAVVWDSSRMPMGIVSPSARMSSAAREHCVYRRVKDPLASAHRVIWVIPSLVAVAAQINAQPRVPVRSDRSASMDAARNAVRALSVALEPLATRTTESVFANPTSWVIPICCACHPLSRRHVPHSVVRMHTVSTDLVRAVVPVIPAPMAIPMRAVGHRTRTCASQTVVDPMQSAVRRVIRSHASALKASVAIPMWVARMWMNVHRSRVD